MPDKAAVNDATPAEEGASQPAAAPATPPKRSPGHRGQDVRDTMAEMAARAHEISLEAGSKMAGALKDVINAAAGLTGFAVESARDLVQYMVRRGQMTQDEADKLIREAEEASSKRKGPAPAAKAEKPESKAEAKPEPKIAPKVAPPAKSAPAAKAPAAAKDNGSAKKAAPAAKKAPAKAPAKAAAKAPAKSAVKRPTAVKASAKPSKPAAKGGSAKKK